MNSKEAPAAGGGTARIAWLDVLRGIAALMLLWAHLFVVEVNDPSPPGAWLPTIQAHFLDRETLAASPHARAAAALKDRFGITAEGAGIAIFFLVSGFVVLRTLDRTDPRNFLLRRAIRLLPVCLVAVLATALVTHLHAAQAGVRQPSGVIDVLASGVAMAELLRRFPTIPALWILTVEILFYLAVAALALRAERITLATLTTLALGGVLFLLAVRAPGVADLLLPSLYLRLNFLAEAGVYILLMLLGSVLYRGRAAGQGGRALLHFLAIGAFFLAAYSEYRGPLELHLRITLADAALALSLFLLALLLEPSGRWTAPLRGLAAISYPLYLVHVPLGWAVLAALASEGLGITAAATLAAAATLLVAWLLHAAVEQPANRLGRRVAPDRPATALPGGAAAHAGPRAADPAGAGAGAAPPDGRQGW